MEPHDVTIVGGGLVGSAMALSLAQQGFDVTLLEREQAGVSLAQGYDGRVSAISEASRRVLSAIGVWDDLSPHAGPIRDIRVADGDSQAKVHFDHRDLSETGGKPFGHMVENHRLRRALAERVAATPGITLRHGATVAALEPSLSGHAVRLAGGERIAAPLLIAADGKRSAMRDMLGIRSRVIAYEQMAMVCTIRHEVPHEGVAVELFLPAGPLAVLPMTGDRACIVWTESATRAPYYMAMPDKAFTDAVHRAMRGYLGEIELLGARHSYPLSLVQASSYVAARAALIGDAAHGIHPIAGQGVNLGYRDVAALSELLGEAKALGLDVGSATLLERYQRWRRFDAVSMLATTDGLNRLFSTDRLPARLLRRAGMRLFDRSGPLKRFFMLNAMGLSGDLPSMLREAA